MSIKVAVSGAAAEAVAGTVPRLVADFVASGITGLDASLWGPAAEAEASARLGWTESVSISRPLVEEILALRDQLRGAGVDHIVLGGMGGSSLAPEVITRTAGVELTVLDSTEPGQVRAALGDRLADTALVISSKSGGTLETDSVRRVYEQAFRAAGIDPASRIVIVTDPGSPLEIASRQAGYRVFTADPNVGGRFSALTAFGLVPSGLAGADIGALLDEAEAVMLHLAVDVPDNPGLVLGAAIAATVPLRDKLAIVTDGSHVVGFGDWAEQLIAESTGKAGTGLLPVVLETVAPELAMQLPDLQVIRLVDEADEAAGGEIAVSGTLGALFLAFEYATAVAGRILGINPFDQPDVESAKTATRALLDARPEPAKPAFTESGIEVRGFAGGSTDLKDAIDALVAAMPENGYLAIQAYLDRTSLADVVRLRDLLARRSRRPVTFGWGPRFLHSTGQFHKGGTPVGVFLQLTQTPENDLAIPERDFSFGQLIQAQASGDASVLLAHGRPVLSLNLTDPRAGLGALFRVLS